MAATAQQGFVDPYNYEFNSPSTAVGYNIPGLGKGGFIDRIGSMLGIDRETQYEAAKVRENQAYERASIDSARAWSEYMDNTQIQRRVKDIEAAGLNPWLAVQNGISGSGAPSVDTGGTAQHGSSSGQSKSGLSQLLMAIAKIIG